MHLYIALIEMGLNSENNYTYPLSRSFLDHTMFFIPFVWSIRAHAILYLSDKIATLRQDKTSASEKLLNCIQKYLNREGRRDHSCTPWMNMWFEIWVVNFFANGIFFLMLAMIYESTSTKVHMQSPVCVCVWEWERFFLFEIWVVYFCC